VNKDFRSLQVFIIVTEWRHRQAVNNEIKNNGIQILAGTVYVQA